MPAGTAVRISTGAPMAPNADSMCEYARVGGGYAILKDTRENAHACTRVEDFAQGQTLLTKGTRIDVRTMDMAAAADVERATVWCRPRVHIMTMAMTW